MFSLFVIYAAGVLSFQIDASIQRRVLSDKGELLAGMEVMLLRSAGDSVPEKSVRTDDRGEYRLFDVSPGRYYLSARTPRVSIRSVP
jgi:hypothetical protein